MVHDLRAVCDAVEYVVRNGIVWRALPVDFPPWEAVYAFWERWNKRGLPLALVHRLRERLRVCQGRNPQPTACIVDSQIVKCADTVAAATRGYHGAPTARWVKTVAAITLEVVKNASPHSFQVVRRRWVVERAFGWLMRWRRLVRDYERHTSNHEAMVYWATVFIMTRRLARYQTGQPPIRRWGGDRKRPDLPAQAAA